LALIAIDLEKLPVKYAMHAINRFAAWFEGRKTNQV
jgi:hypothetical protein